MFKLFTCVYMLASVLLLFQPVAFVVIVLALSFRCQCRVVSCEEPPKEIWMECR